jgi:hypothetical protein
VQVTEHAADGGSSNGSQLGTVQHASVLQDHGSSNSSGGAAGGELLAAAQQANSSRSDLQLQLDWQPREVQGFTVQAAEVREVFRMLEEDSSSSSSSSRRIQYWDAFAGAWLEMQLPSASRVVAGDAVAVTAG